VRPATPLCKSGDTSAARPYRIASSPTDPGQRNGAVTDYCCRMQNAWECGGRASATARGDTALGSLEHSQGAPTSYSLWHVCSCAPKGRAPIPQLLYRRSANAARFFLSAGAPRRSHKWGMTKPGGHTLPLQHCKVNVAALVRARIIKIQTDRLGQCERLRRAVDCAHYRLSVLLRLWKAPSKAWWF